MEPNAYALLAIELIANGIIVFILQRIITNKLDSISRKKALKAKIIDEFFDKAVYIGNALIKARTHVNNTGGFDPKHLTELNDALIDLNSYSEIFLSDFDIYNVKLKEIIDEWDKIAYNGRKLDTGIDQATTQILLGNIVNSFNSLQKQIKELIALVRDNY